MRDIDHIKSDIADNEREIRELGDKQRALRQELFAAQVQAATEEGHPWLGKRLKRRAFGGRTQRGTLTIYDPSKHRKLRGLRRYGLDAGALIVMSTSGLSAHLFNDFWGLDQ